MDVTIYDPAPNISSTHFFKKYIERCAQINVRLDSLGEELSDVSQKLLEAQQSDDNQVIRFLRDEQRELKMKQLTLQDEMKVGRLLFLNKFAGIYDQINTYKNHFNPDVIRLVQQTTSFINEAFDSLKCYLDNPDELDGMDSNEEVLAKEKLLEILNLSFTHKNIKEVNDKVWDLKSELDETEFKLVFVSHLIDCMLKDYSPTNNSDHFVDETKD